MTSNDQYNRVAAVVVTYNRLQLLTSTISALQRQTRPPDTIIVINNSSTDGTEEWLREQQITTITQGNVGGAGGFCTGFRTAFDGGYEWIWCMDDDVAPAPECLENLLNKGNPPIRVPLRHTPEGRPHLGTDTIRFNFTNPFSGLWAEMLGMHHLEQDLIPLEGPSFEGPMTHRSVVENIGLPDAGFFIFADDSDFFIRANRAGFAAQLIRAAILTRMLPFSMNTTAVWKRYYEIRNIVVLDMRYGSASVKLLRPFYYVMKMLIMAKTLEERRSVIRGYIHGIQRRLGKL